MYIYQAIDMNQSMAGMDFGRDVAYCNRVWICILDFCYFCTPYAKGAEIDSTFFRGYSEDLLNLPKHKFPTQITILLALHFKFKNHLAIIPLYVCIKAFLKSTYPSKGIRNNNSCFSIYYTRNGTKLSSLVHSTWHGSFDYLHKLWKDNMRLCMTAMFCFVRVDVKTTQWSTKLQACVLWCVSFCLPNPISEVKQASHLLNH